MIIDYRDLYKYEMIFFFPDKKLEKLLNEPVPLYTITYLPTIRTFFCTIL